MTMSDELQKLHNLKEQGALTEEEFVAAKKRVIEGEPEDVSGTRAHTQRTQSEPRVASGLNEFRLSNRDRWLGGVCGGLAEQTKIPAWSWRILFVLLGLLHGIGVVAYVLLWIFVPRQAFPAQPAAASSSAPPSPPPQS